MLFKNDAKDQKSWFLGMLLGTLGANLLGNKLGCKGVKWSNITWQGVMRAGEGSVRAGQDF